MNWQDILGNNWTVTEQHEAISPSTESGQARFAIPLPGLTLLEVSGDEASDFLQSQFSNDINLVDEKSWQLSSYCNPKGRILALLYLYRLGDSYQLILPTEIAAATLQRLQMYVLRSKVKLRLCNEILLMGLAMDEVKALPDNLPCLPEDVHAVISEHGISVLRLNDSPPRFLLAGEASHISKLWDTVSGHFQQVGSNRWHRQDIESGYPQVFASTREMFIPQMLNLDALKGINFKKGCYPGQEIVARMHYLGKLKKRMYLGSVTLAKPGIDTSPKAGDPVFSDSFGQQAAGNIVNIAPSDTNDHYVLLISAQVSSAEQDDLHLTSVDGDRIKLEKLPYQFPTNPKVDAS